MGTFDDGKQALRRRRDVDDEPVPVHAERDGSRWDPIAGSSHITRLSVDLSKKRPSAYGIEQLYPQSARCRARTIATTPCRIATASCRAPTRTRNPARAAPAMRASTIRSARSTLFNAGADTSLAECCFAPKSANAPEGAGYLMGVATRNTEGGRADLVILDAEHLADGPVATVHLPMRAVGQIHGWWVPEAQLPKRA